MREEAGKKAGPKKDFVCLFVCSFLKMKDIWIHTLQAARGLVQTKRWIYSKECASNTWGFVMQEAERVRCWVRVAESLLHFASFLFSYCLFCSQQPRSTLSLTNSHRRYTLLGDWRVCHRERDFLEAHWVIMANITTDFLDFSLEWLFKILLVLFYFFIKFRHLRSILISPYSLLNLYICIHPHNYHQIKT